MQGLGVLIVKKKKIWVLADLVICKGQRRRKLRRIPGEQVDPNSRVEELTKIRQISGKKR